MRKGFTLIELMTVLILGTSLLMIAWPNYTEMGKREKEAQVKLHMHMLQYGAEEFATKTEGIYSSNLSCTVGMVRTIVYGGSDPLANDPYTIISLVYHQIQNPIVPANGAFTEGLIPCHAAGTSGCVGYAAYDKAGVTPPSIGYAVSYLINGDGIDDLIPLILGSAK